MRDQLGTASVGGRSGERGMNAPRLSSTNADRAFLWGGKGGAKNPPLALRAVRPCSPSGCSSFQPRAVMLGAESALGQRPELEDQSGCNGEVRPQTAALGPGISRRGLEDANSSRVPKQLCGGVGVPERSEQYKRQPPPVPKPFQLCFPAAALSGARDKESRSALRGERSPNPPPNPTPLTSSRAPTAPRHFCSLDAKAAAAGELRSSPVTAKNSATLSCSGMVRGWGGGVGCGAEPGARRESTGG